MKPKHPYQENVQKSFLLLLPIFLISVLVITGGDFSLTTWKDCITSFLTLALFNTMFFLMVFSGKTDTYRAILFAILAVFFCISFMGNLVELRGTVNYSEDDILGCDIPFCHIVTTMVIIPMAVKQTIIFPGQITGHYAAIASMLLFVIGAALALGRGFCSWACFYGGWDDASSRILKKPVIKNISRRLRFVSFAILVAVAVCSALEMAPVYCTWLCPFKAVTESEAITDAWSVVRTVIFWSLFLGLAIVLPLLTKKRVQCATFCPMGALMSLTNKINVFEVSVDKESCVGCGKCVKTCPMLAVGMEDIRKGKAGLTCSKCGKCVDACPTGALHYHIKGTPKNRMKGTARILFLYAAFLFLMFFCAGYVKEILNLLLSLL